MSDKQDPFTKAFTGMGMAKAAKKIAMLDMPKIRQALAETQDAIKGLKTSVRRGPLARARSVVRRVEAGSKYRDRYITIVTSEAARPGRGMTKAEGKHLVQLKMIATGLCCLIAESRGKVHAGHLPHYMREGSWHLFMTTLSVAFLTVKPKYRKKVAEAVNRAESAEVKDEASVVATVGVKP